MCILSKPFQRLYIYFSTIENYVNNDNQWCCRTELRHAAQEDTSSVKTKNTHHPQKSTTHSRHIYTCHHISENGHRLDENKLNNLLNLDLTHNPYYTSVVIGSMAFLPCTELLISLQSTQGLGSNLVIKCSSTNLHTNTHMCLTS